MRTTAAAEPTTHTWLPVAALSTTLVLWASAFVAIRHLGHDVSPGALSLGRLLVGTVALGVFVASRPRRRVIERRHWPARRDWPLLLPCGVLWFGIYNLALNASEQRIDAGTAALIIRIGPIAVALLASVFLGEQMTRWLAIEVAVGLAGVLVIGQGSSANNGDVVGVLLAVAAALSYAAAVISQKPLLGSLPALEVTFIACAIGTVVCLPWTGDLLDVVRTAPTSSLLWIGYLGLFPTALAFTTWVFALAHTPASTAALTMLLVPVLATLLAWLLLDEVPPALAFVGGAMCIAGVVLTRRTPKAADPPGALRCPDDA